MRRALLASAALALLASACHTSSAPPVVEPVGREVTIFIHGIKGSFLVTEQGERAWLSASDLLSSGDRSLALPPGGEDRFGPLRPEGPLTRLSVFPLLGTADIYLPFLEYGSERLPGFVPFAYDWRLDAHEAVVKLARRIDELAERRHGDLRVNLVGHSLGGLIALTYVRFGDGDPTKEITWKGARHVKRLALVGAPFGGSPSFLADVLRGDKTGRNERLLAPEAMASFVSALELLPPQGTFFVDAAGAPLPLDARDPKTWERVPAERRPAQATLAAARTFREGLRDAPDAKAQPDDLEVLVVAGTGRPTAGAVALARKDDIDSADFETSPTVPGDSRVPEKACLPPRPLRYTLVTTKADHVNLLNDSDVQESVRALVELSAVR